MSTRTEIVTHLERFLPMQELRDDDDIFSKGFVSSMFAMQLVAFVEDHFGISVENDDLELDNFRSVDALTAFVEGKRKTGAA